tara:strand:+ start:89 stop:1168 length:1080 start_codon:yes stop_codon:yes gene_type:complete
MALENGTYVNSLVTSNPASTDGLAQADDHIRLIKSTIKNTFPNLTGPVTATQASLNNTTSIPSVLTDLGITDGNGNGQVLQTDGNGNFSFIALPTGTTDTNYYVDGGSVSGTTLTLTRSGLGSLSITGLPTSTGATGPVGPVGPAGPPGSSGSGSSVPASDVTYLASISATNVSSTQYGYLSGVSSGVQTQLDSGANATTALTSRVTTLESVPAGGGGDITGVIAGTGMTGGGSSGTVTVTHGDTSSQASVTNSGANVIQSITVDGFGHITGLTSAPASAAYTQPMTLGAVGTYAQMQNHGASTIAAGGTVAGSNLKYHNINWSETGTPAASGTWRVMGRFAASGTGSTNSISVCLRIS